MQADNKAIIYNFSQYSYTKGVRDRIRIRNRQLNILSSIYYLSNINPQRISKRSINRLNPQINQVNLYSDLNILEERGLILQTWINSKKIDVSITKEGLNVIRELYSIDAIQGLIDKY